MRDRNARIPKRIHWSLVKLEFKVEDSTILDKSLEKFGAEIYAPTERI